MTSQSYITDQPSLSSGLVHRSSPFYRSSKGCPARTRATFPVPPAKAHCCRRNSGAPPERPRPRCNSYRCGEAFAFGPGPPLIPLRPHFGEFGAQEGSNLFQVLNLRLVGRCVALRGVSARNNRAVEPDAFDAPLALLYF